MPVIDRTGEYRLPYPYKSNEHAGWAFEKVTRSDRKGGWETVTLKVETTAKDQSSSITT